MAEVWNVSVTAEEGTITPSEAVHIVACVQTVTGGAVCERCGSLFQRRTSERRCPDCLGPLRGLRQDAQLTQAELAVRVGCRTRTIPELERDAYHPAFTLAEAIARELGVTVLEVFPGLEITKSEALRLLRATNRDFPRLGLDPCGGKGHWIRFDYAEVATLAAERDEFRTNWISFNAIETTYGMPWWVSRELERRGKLEVEIGDGRSARLGARLVRRAQFEAVLEELRANRMRARCPHCGKVVKLGRKAHARCLGPLGSRRYWILLDPEARKLRWRAHGELVRARLAQRPREAIVVWFKRWYESTFGRKPPARKLGDWYFRRFGSTAMYGQLNTKLATENSDRRPDAKRPGNKVGRPSQLQDDPELLAQARALKEKGHSDKRIAQKLSYDCELEISRDQVWRALRNLRETPSGT